VLLCEPDAWTLPRHVTRYATQWSTVTTDHQRADTMTNKLCLMEPKLTNLDRAGQNITRQ